MTLARDWHALSDHAADGAPFGGPLCNCEQIAPRVQQLITAALNAKADEIEMCLSRAPGLVPPNDFDQGVLRALRTIRPT